MDRGSKFELAIARVPPARQHRTVRLDADAGSNWHSKGKNGISRAQQPFTYLPADTQLGTPLHSRLVCARRDRTERDAMFAKIAPEFARGGERSPLDQPCECSTQNPERMRGHRHQAARA